MDAEAVLLRTEAWMVAGEPLPEGGSPGQSDRRIEVVSVAATVRYGRKVITRLSAREIIRGDDGRPVALREIRLPGEDEEPKGPMFGLLPPIRPSREQQAMAAAMVELMKERGAG